MTSRERIRYALTRQKVDRIPNGLGGCEATGLHVKAYEKLKRILGVNDSQNRMYTFMANAVVEPRVLDAMNGDIIILNSWLCPVPLWGKYSKNMWKNQDLWGEKYQVPIDWAFRTDKDGTIWWENYNLKCPPGGIYFDAVPDDYAKTLHRLEKPLMPDDYNPPHDIPDDTLRSMQEAARWLYENTDYSICCGECVTDLQMKPGGMINWWMRLLDEPEVVHEFLHKACEAGISQMKLVNQAVGKYCDMILLSDDFGNKEGVMIGPDLWRDIYKPHYKRLYSEYHMITDMKLNFHTCGSVYDILGDLIECGVDILNPVQISAKNMEPQKLKNEFGDRLIFYGGCFDPAITPPPTSPEIVYETVKRNIKIFSQGGGYIFAGEHNIPGDTPISHLKAIMNAYNDCCSEYSS